MKLAQGMILAVRTSSDELEKRGRQARSRVGETFSIEAIISLFEQLYIKLISR